MALRDRPVGFEVGGPMIQQVSTNGFSVRWVQPAGGRVELCVRRKGGDVERIAARRDGELYDFAVSNLAAGTEVEYWVEPEVAPPESRPAQVWRTRTVRPAGETFSFIAFGDSGRGEPRQYALGRTMNRYAVDFVIHVGDLVYGPKTLSEYGTSFYEPYRELLAKSAFYPALGNHDFGPTESPFFCRQFDLPLNGPNLIDPEHCYWFDYGDARIVAIDSNIPEPMLYRKVRPWLREVFKGSGKRWRFVYLHHPAYTGEVYPPDLRIQRTLVPEMERRGVDMVFNGHAHLYERTLPLLGGVPHPDGIVYITTGAGGSGLRPDEVNPPPYIAVQHAACDSFTVVTVADELLHLKQISVDNTVIDSFTVVKRREAVSE